MKTSILAAGIACLVVLDGPAGARQPPAATSTIVEVGAVTLPAYDSNPRIALVAATPAEYAQAAGDAAFVMERVTYRSDDLKVFAYLYRPTTPPKDTRLPVVIFNRGSYVRDDFSYEALMLGNRLAHEGYVTIAPMLRGSGGAPGRDEMGGADLNDITNVMNVIREIPYADPARVFMYGESRGGIMSLLAAKQGFPARAIAVWGAITDLGAYLETDAGARQLAAKIWPGYPENQAIVESRSAIKWPEKINVPVLLMNGGADLQVSPLHAIQLATALEKLRKPYELKIFHGEGHVSPARASERYQDAARWFRRFDQHPVQPK